MSSTRAFPLHLVFFDLGFVIFPFSIIAAPVVEAKVDRLLRRRWVKESPKAQIIGGKAACICQRARRSRST